MGGQIVKVTKGNYVEKATNIINYSGGDINKIAGNKHIKTFGEMCCGEADEAPESEGFKKCKADIPPVAPSDKIGTCSYYKWRFENFMGRHDNDECKHDPPDYYYGPMREIKGGWGIIDGINEWWTPSLEKEMGNEQLKEYKREHGTFKAVPSESYGYKYCIRFTKVLMPTLSEEGKTWLRLAKKLLQKYMEEGVVNLTYTSDKNKEFNNRYELSNPEKLKKFYTKIEERNDEFRDFAFATHPDAYLKAGLTSIPISDKIKVAMTPDFKELGKGATWEQGMIVLEEQIDYWYKQAKAGVKEAQRMIEDAVREAEEYLKTLRKALDIWDWANKQLDKYRHMPWLE